MGVTFRDVLPLHLQTRDDVRERLNPRFPQGVQPLGQARSPVDLNVPPGAVMCPFLHGPGVVPLGRLLVCMSQQQRSLGQAP